VAKTISSATTAVILIGNAATAILSVKTKKTKQIAGMARVERMNFNASSVSDAFHQFFFVTAGLLVLTIQMKVSVNVEIVPESLIAVITVPVLNVAPSATECKIVQVVRTKKTVKLSRATKISLPAPTLTVVCQVKAGAATETMTAGTTRMKRIVTR
jgi:hypothetical protein